MLDTTSAQSSSSFLERTSVATGQPCQGGCPSFVDADTSTLVDLAQVVVQAAALACIPHDVARRYQLLPLALDEQRFCLALADPENLIALDQVRALLGPQRSIVSLRADAADIRRAIEQHYEVRQSIDGILQAMAPEDAQPQASTYPVDESSQPVVRLVEALLADAVQRAASDIHFEPELGFLRVRYRLDGVLQAMRSLHPGWWPGMLVRLKVLAGMNIAETRAPQDGRFSLHLSGRSIDFRVSSHPVTHGENVVLRILDRQQGIVPLSQLGLAEDTLARLTGLLAQPEGLILVTGPTGSGKTTTLYSILTHLNREGVNIMTLEDPVEYPLPLVRQTSINETAKLDFAQGIRSILRQDPDIILVGEIRDAATADMAFRAAMTGHQVYATLHSNSALGAIPRLLDIGVLPDIMASNLIGVVAQRLVRVLCPHCRQPLMPNQEELALPGITADSVLYRPVGCEHCRHIGYHGRMALMEVLRVDAALEELIARRASARQLRHHLLEKGFRPLVMEGLRRVLQGMTSLAEVQRVVGLQGVVS